MADAAGAPAEGAQPEQSAAPDAGAAPEAAAQPDIASLIEQSQAPMHEQLNELRSILDGVAQQTAPPAQEEQTPAAPDYSFLDQDSQNYEPARAAEAFMELIGQQHQESMQPVAQQVSSLAERLDQIQVDGEYERLADEFPDLRDAQVNEKVLKSAADVAMQLAGSIGLTDEKQVQRLAESPTLIRSVYMMGRAAEAANAENAQQGPNAATLEGPGGASPADPAQGAVDAIMGAGGRSVLPY